MSNPFLNIRTLTEDIFDVSGNTLHKNLSFIVSEKKTFRTEENVETCTIFLDNGKKKLADFDTYVVAKKYLYDNSI